MHYKSTVGFILLHNSGMLHLKSLNIVFDLFIMAVVVSVFFFHRGIKPEGFSVLCTSLFCGFSQGVFSVALEVLSLL